MALATRLGPRLPIRSRHSLHPKICALYEDIIELENVEYKALTAKLVRKISEISDSPNNQQTYRTTQNHRARY